MTQTTQFDPDGLKFKIFDPKKHQLPKIDFRQTNGEDPLAVQEYYENYIFYSRSDTDEVKYVIEYFDNWIGFFSIDLTRLHPKQPELIPQRKVTGKQEGFYQSTHICTINKENRYRSTL